MRELKSYIFRNYGYKLTDEELELLINWYASNEYKLDEDNLNDEVLGFLVKTFPDKDVVLLEDDSSNITLRHGRRPFYHVRHGFRFCMREFCPVVWDIRYRSLDKMGLILPWHP